MNVRALLVSVAIAAASASMSWAQVTGTVKLDGPAPEPKTVDMSTNPDCAKLHANPVPDDTVVVDKDGNLKNVIVAIKPDDGQDLGTGEPPKDPVVLDQKGCMYNPHVVAMVAGQTLVVKNSDDFMHNVHSLSDDNPPINQAMLKDPKGIELKDITEPEIFMLKCDVHPWMKAWVGVFAHPYFAVTSDDGKYSFDTKGLKDGQYTLQAWHERYGTQTQKITVKDGKATADFHFKSDAKADAGTGNATLASDKKMASCPSCSQVTRAALAAKTIKLAN